MAVTTGAVLGFHDLGKTYPDGTTALEHVDLEVAAGDFVTVVGPSGCGKSTLLRIASGLEPATAGTMDVDAERIEIIPHGAVIHIDRPGREVDEGLIFDEPLRLAFVGRGWPKKGLGVANELADRLAGQRLLVEPALAGDHEARRAHAPVEPDRVEDVGRAGDESSAEVGP